MRYVLGITGIVYFRGISQELSIFQPWGFSSGVLRREESHGNNHYLLEELVDAYYDTIANTREWSIV